MGDLVLDPFAGTGTTLVVCEELGRNYIGIEINPKLVEICRQRLSEMKSEKQLDRSRNVISHVGFTE